MLLYIKIVNYLGEGRDGMGGEGEANFGIDRIMGALGGHKIIAKLGAGPCCPPHNRTSVPTLVSYKVIFKKKIRSKNKAFCNIS